MNLSELWTRKPWWLKVLVFLAITIVTLPVATYLSFVTAWTGLGGLVGFCSLPFWGMVMGLALARFLK